MKYAHGLSINTNTIDKILEIAYSKNYIEKNNYDLVINKCDEFKLLRRIHLATQTHKHLAS